ncbi:MAG: trypsin-like peptidase domain-containing protein [Rhodospirillales bacterium]|nr:trypsin-like peptidase domain-containing protein [Rhodospirillales bacterium]
MRAGRPVGAGCLVHGRLVLTCAHVVREALGLPRTAVERPKDPIPIEFPAFADITDLWAHAIVWHPWADTVADNGLTDIAVLDIGRELGDPMPAHLLKSEDERLGDVIAYGFPEDAPLGARHGHWIKGHAELPVIGPAWFPIHHRSAPSEPRSFIRPGCSGGPVVVDDGGPHAGRVAGWSPCATARASRRNRPPMPSAPWSCAGRWSWRRANWRRNIRRGRRSAGRSARPRRRVLRLAMTSQARSTS